MEPYCDVDLSDERVRGFVAALRPFREGGPRLEVERTGTKVVAHNYGHGGSGITMCWGSSLEVLRRLEPDLLENVRVGILGSGVMGLCTARLLLERGHPVTVYSKNLPPETTSNVAGGLWAPTHVGSFEPSLNDRILRDSWHYFRKLPAQEFGVEEVPLFETLDRSHPLDPIPPDLVPPAKEVPALPFRGRHGPSLVSRTLLIETPRFLSRLVAEIKERGGRFAAHEMKTREALASLPESVFVNCLGLGAREFAQDPAVRPIRGQLVLLDPAPKSFIIDHGQGYIISRRDILVLGGTFEEGEENPDPQEATCREILAKNRNFFGWVSPGVTNS